VFLPTEASNISTVLQNAERGVSIADGVLKLITKITNINDVRRWNALLHELAQLPNSGPTQAGEGREGLVSTRGPRGSGDSGKGQGNQREMETQKSKMIISAPPETFHQLLDLVEIRIQIWQFLLEAIKRDDRKVDQAAIILCERYRQIIKGTRSAAYALEERLREKDL
jgi:hypothetical protein